MPTIETRVNHPAPAPRKPWRTPEIIVGEASESEKSGLTIDTTFAGPS